MTFVQNRNTKQNTTMKEQQGPWRWMPLLTLLLTLLMAPVEVMAQGCRVSGRVVNSGTGEALELATVIEPLTRQGAVTDADGTFSLQHLPRGTVSLQVRSFGYQTLTVQLPLQHDTSGVVIRLMPQSLKLDAVTVTAQRGSASETTSYVLDRTTLDHMQMLNVADVQAMLPGGKSDADVSLMGDSRIALRSQGNSEMGNTSFGTAIEVDGVRLQQNGQMELTGASTRTVAASNIASVEVITGIPSVEYGDLSNGIVRVHTRQNKSPYIIELTTKPHTKLLSLSKGWQLAGHEGRSRGVLNVSLEHARSVSDLTSPHTTYQRNVLTLAYNRTLDCRNSQGEKRPLHITASVTGNLGGYNSEDDPDAFTGTWQKVRDYVVRGQVSADWRPDFSWLSRLRLQVTGSYADQQNRSRSNASSASAQPQIHATDDGYHVGYDYDEAPDAAIIMSPIGYWYREAVTDNKPVSLGAYLKSEWNHIHEMQEGSDLTSNLKFGMEYTATGNAGRGTYYTDMRYAPTWREARYDTLPYQHGLSAYVEERLSARLRHDIRVSLTGGLREDATFISGSDYGTVTALSPRANVRVEAGPHSKVTPGKSSIALYGGWGKSVKLPSMAVLFPATAYSDQISFAPGSMADGRTYYAYHTHASRALYNKGLKWQYSTQAEIGLDWKVGGLRLHLDAYNITTHAPYLATSVYTPYTYRLTTQADLEGCPIASADRQYSVDRHTGVVTVSDRTGTLPSQTLEGMLRHSYLSNMKYVNGSDSRRMGIEWVLDLPHLKALHTDVRIDGNFTRYKGIETTLIASRPAGSATMANGQPYAYIGYYDGSAAMGNGNLTRRVNTNVTVTTHIPAVRLILSVRLEATFHHYSRRLQTGGIVLADSEKGGYTGTHAEDLSNHYSVIYPRYYSTWDDPDTMIPFEEAFLDARQHDTALYQELCKLVSRSNTNYFFNSNSISPYFSANLSITKEIGDHLSLSFQATNFWNNTANVRTTQTHSESTLYGSSYIPTFYYGLSLNVKI